MKKLITSALPYVNNVPHLGNIIGCVLSADVYARFCRSRGYETLYICGNDEYGTATENKAREEGLTPREICDKYHAIHDAVYRDFNISFDYFGRTSTEEQTQIAQEIFRDLDAQGYISEYTSQRTYCEKDGMFLADRYVEGICPYCNYADARGDQCDSCGKLLEPEKLLQPRCKFCGNPPDNRETSHLHLELGALQTQLTEWFEASSKAGRWSNNAIQTTAGWLERGLEPRPITRDLKWGIPVPKPGYENKVFYVWFDAPIGYISITARLLPTTWKTWWQNAKEVELYQFMAKDNIPFHTVIFPASLIGSGKNWTLLHHINSTEYLNYEDAKFSKSRGIGVFGTDVRTVGLPVDLWRFYLLLVRPEKTDSVFSWSEFYERVNSEFINNIGNLVHRVLTYLHGFLDGKIVDGARTPAQLEFIAACQEDLQGITESMEAVKLRDSLRQILALGNRANKYFQDAAPWEQIKVDRQATATSVSVLAYVVRAIAIVLEPFMPETCQRIQATMNLDKPSWDDALLFSGLDGHAIGTPKILYEKLDTKDAEKWRKKFGGNAPDFGKFHLRVGLIAAVAAHPEAAHLYVLTVDMGGETRTIVAGLTKNYTAEELQGRKVVILANLQEANLRGVLSQGMVLTCEKRNKLELLEAGEFPVGAYAESGGSQRADIQISLDDFKAAPFRVEDGIIRFDDEIVTLEGKPLKTYEILSGKLK